MLRAVALISIINSPALLAIIDPMSYQTRFVGATGAITRVVGFPDVGRYQISSFNLMSVL